MPLWHYIAGYAVMLAAMLDRADDLCVLQNRH